MTGPVVAASRIDRDVDWVGPVLLIPPGVLLAFVTSLGLVTGIVVALAGALGFLAVGRIPSARDHAVPGIVPIAAFGVLALTAPALPVASLLAGVSAVAVLLALGRASAPPAYRDRAWRGVGVPFLGFLVAFATAIVLPVSRQYVGVAALLAVVAIAALAMLFSAPDRPDGVDPETS